ncbi:MAG: hypothetical protein ONB16_03195 [candidate division KSB1 bacterium]|nr:hypothetical protein [candidate division KSB1 bacterium]MDZ7317626.1 hypothetical protein [candidate division KSB1 bacterium]MDZ7340851.1 hypothetical protein [candidate division KSB1 bacterium]
MLSIGLTILGSIGSPLLGIILPTVIFLISFVVTWLLYKHFSSKH